MLIEANLVAAYKMIAGKGSLILEMQEGGTVREAFLLVLKRAPGLKPHWVDKAGNPSGHVHVFLNGDDISTLTDGFETKLVEQDVLEFIPPLSGG